MAISGVSLVPVLLSLGTGSGFKRIWFGKLLLNPVLLEVESSDRLIDFHNLDTIFKLDSGYNVCQVIETAQPSPLFPGEQTEPEHHRRYPSDTTGAVLLFSNPQAPDSVIASRRLPVNMRIRMIWVKVVKEYIAVRYTRRYGANGTYFFRQQKTNNCFGSQWDMRIVTE